MSDPSQSIPVEDFHGTLVADPFRYLEDPQSTRTKAFVTEQNAATRQALDAIPGRGEIHDRLRQLYDYPTYFAPVRRNGQLFFLYNDGRKNQPSLYTVDEQQPSAEPRLLVNPNAMNENGTTAVTQFSVSPNGQKLAYALAESGSDWQVIRVVDVETGEHDADLIQWCKFSKPAWHPDGHGFFYTRFPARDETRVVDESQNAMVYWHELGTEQSADKLVYSRPDAPDFGFHVSISGDGQYLVLHVTKGTDRENRVYVRGLQEGSKWQALFDEGDASYLVVGNEGEAFYVLTDLGAGNGRVIACDLAAPAPENWREVLPESECSIASVAAAQDSLIVTYVEDAHHRLSLLNLKTRKSTNIPLETLGSVTEVSADQNEPIVYFGLTSFLMPVSVFRLDTKTCEVTLVWDARASFDTKAYVTHQVFFESRDGTRVPMFLTHRRDLARNGDTPTLITGYGGFNISRTPAFSPAALMFIEAGGIYALTNMRGGAEYGDAWHRAGMLANKQNVFDDFQGAAEYLVEEGYTNSKRIGIIGGSNGGLLVAACMLQRPDLYGAVICQVPVIDMLRYHRFTVGRYWVGEYGNAVESKEQFEFMYKYSPLHNVVQNRVYPPILITTADSDDRVVPSHPYKFAATLQAASPGVHPILLRVETQAGHGAGKPISKIIDEQTDIHSFLNRTIGDSASILSTPAPQA